MLPPILAATLGMIYLVMKQEVADVPKTSPAGAKPAAAAREHPLEPLALIHSLEEAEGMEKNPGKTREALWIFQNLAASNPESDRAWGGLGRCLLATGQPDAALNALEHACQLNVVEFRHFAARADARRAGGDLRGALADYSDALRLRPGDVVVSNRILLLALQMGQPDLFDLKLGAINKSRGTKADAAWAVGVAAREMQSGDFASGLSILQQAREQLSPVELARLLDDPVFVDRRGVEFLEKFRSLPLAQSE